MAGISQVIACEGVEAAAAEEGGADQDVDEVKHGNAPGSAAKPLYTGGMLPARELVGVSH
jgi:hypothetical protein